MTGGYLGLVSGRLTIELRVGRRIRALGPLTVIIDATREVVFDVLSEPYLGRQTRAIAEKIRILERGENMVLAEHRTSVGSRLVAVTVETVRFTRPSRIDFRLTHGTGTACRRDIRAQHLRRPHRARVHRRTRHRLGDGRHLVGQPRWRVRGSESWPPPSTPSRSKPNAATLATRNSREVGVYPWAAARDDRSLLSRRVDHCRALSGRSVWIAMTHRVGAHVVERRTIEPVGPRCQDLGARSRCSARAGG